LQGWALSDMTSAQYQPIFNASKDVDLRQGKVVVIGPGTGLGTCLIMPNINNGQSIYTSEAGHSTIPYVSFADEKDQKLKQIPTFEVPYYVKVDRGVDFDGDVLDYTYEMLFKELSNIVHTHYENEINGLKSYIETSRIIKPVATSYDERKIIKGNITNSDNIICDVIEGNVINCDNVKVREIKGNTVNCEIYKEE
jgi:hypothetical protein